MLAVVLAVSLAPTVPASALADEGTPSRVPIEDMLTAGDYVEGEAIAIMRADAQPDATAQAEQLAEVGADSMDLAVEGAEQTESTLDDEVALRAQDAPDDEYTVQLVTDHNRTTEQILRDLYDDPNVVSAEPNYTMDTAEAFGNEAEAQAAAEVAVDIASAPAAQQDTGTLQSAVVPGQLGAQATGIDPYSIRNTGDLTSLQWAFGEISSTPEATSAPAVDKYGYTLNVPDWFAGRSNENARPNASGTVCIMDTGIDVKHPDLQGVLYEFTAEQQMEYGCGPYGYNASGDEYPVNTVRASGDHGMHVAGIVAAAWNLQGTSGVAHGIKIFAVNVLGGNSRVMTMSSVIKGFQFLVKAAKDVNLKAVNCSWGTKQTCFALGTMVNELGKKGVNTAIATGNDHENLDDRLELASQVTNSPYAIRVNAAGPDGKPTVFSSYGQTSTDVYAPGQGILSTYPVEVTLGSGEFFSCQRFVRFFPTGADPASLVACERFDSETPGVKFFKANPAISENAEEITPTRQDAGFGDKHSVSFKLSDLAKESHSKTEMQGLVGENGYLYMAIPVNSTEDLTNAKWISAAFAMSDGFRPAGGVASVTYKNAEDKPVEVDTSPSIALKQGWESASSAELYQVQWHIGSFFCDAIAQAASEAHDRINAGEQFVQSSQAGTFAYKDPGVLSGLYGWENGGKTYVIAKVALDRTLSGPPSDTALYIDEVAVGRGYEGGGAYEYMSGTSMASPAIAGCMAVIAKDEPESATLTDAQLEQEARERAAKLLASVDYDADLAKLCRTGGRVNLAANHGFAKKAPLITRVTSDGSALTITGYFFGTSGSLEIDGASVTASSWSDEKIVAPVSGLGRGSHVVKVVNADGAVSQAVFSHAAGTGSAAALYEHDLALPTSVASFGMQHRLWGSLVACDGSIYGSTATIKYQQVQGIWRYDIAKNAWSSIALPDGYLNAPLEMNNMAEYNGSLYLCNHCAEPNGGASDETHLWRYDPAKNAWTMINMVVPSGAALCSFGGKLFFVGGWYSNVPGISGNVIFALLDPDKRTITPVDSSKANIVLGSRLTVTASCNNMYCYSIQVNEDTGESATRFYRLSYDESANAMSAEDLSAQFATMAPSPAATGESGSAKAHLAIAGLPDGVAVIGAKDKDADSFELGQDTFVIYDDSKSPERLGRTSTYQRAFDPMAVYYDGRLYAMGYSPAEPDVAYFRATDLWDAGIVTKEPTCTDAGMRTHQCLYRTASYTEAIPAFGHAWDAGNVTKAAAPGVAGERTFTCKTCGATRTEAIAALPGGATGKSYNVAGNTYKVKSNDKNTVTFAKAKVAKSAKVPATVKINGKTYKVAAIGAKAFTEAKKKLTSVTIGKNVEAIGASAFAGCAKLKTVTLKSKKLKKAKVKKSLAGSSVKTMKVKVGKSKANKTYAKKYKKIFTKANAGKKVAVRA